MKTLYIDAFSGVSGDMMLGALLDLGASEAALREGLHALGISGEVALHVDKTQRCGITGTQAHVHLLGHGHAHEHKHEHEHKHGQEHTHEHMHEHEHAHEHEHEHAHERGHGHEHTHEHAHRGFSAIVALIDKSALPPEVKARAGAMFRRLGEAEAAVHGIALEEVHFHEVGAADALVDIVGCCILLRQLGIERVVCSPIALGGGTVKCAHGVLPVPAPATARLLSGIPAYGGEARLGELTTPTGATIAASIADEYGPMPCMRMAAVGYGFGQRNTGGLNALRLVVGEAGEAGEYVYELRANIDDMTGEALAFAAERIGEAGALDVWTQPIGMKKGRAGVMLCALAKEETLRSVLHAFEKHTSSWGVRYSRMPRVAGEREWFRVQTKYGEIRVKTGGGKHKPEYEDCARASLAHGVTLQEVYRGVEAALGNR